MLGSEGCMPAPLRSMQVTVYPELYIMLFSLYQHQLPPLMPWMSTKCGGFNGVSSLSPIFSLSLCYPLSLSLFLSHVLLVGIYINFDHMFCYLCLFFCEFYVPSGWNKHINGTCHTSFIQNNMLWYDINMIFDFRATREINMLIMTRVLAYLVICFTNYYCDQSYIYFYYKIDSEYT